MTRPFELTLCADDYAMTPGVSRGILEALDAGALTATSVMTTSPWWPEASLPLRRHAARASIGLHINLTLGAPLGALPQLAPDGRLPGIATLLRLARRRSLPLSEIAEEIERQVDRFIEVFGRPPDHADGHQHVHVLGPIAPIVLDVLQRRGVRPWLRDSADRVSRIVVRGVAMKKALGLAVLARDYGGLVRRAGFSSNDGFSGFSNFDARERYDRQFARYLRAPGRRHLIMCHPGYADAALAALDPVVETREQELRFLLDGTLPRLLLEAGATLMWRDAPVP